MVNFSECSSETIGRAHAEHKICVTPEYCYGLRPRVQSHPAAQKLWPCNFGPLGRAFLSGLARDMDKLEEGDMRHSIITLSGSILCQT